MLPAVAVKVYDESDTIAFAAVDAKCTLLAAEETAVAPLNASVAAAAAPNRKLCDVVVIDAALVVMRLVPVSAPTKETPKTGDKIVEDTTVMPTFDDAAA